ncbi:hypothetical protein HMPREF1144_0553 [Klebsiella sp. OBRC7]|nr:hypothetical protein HMPREF1144_0553 [Klebsiella sp. OBRC7]
MNQKGDFALKLSVMCAMHHFYSSLTRSRREKFLTLGGE